MSNLFYRNPRLLLLAVMLILVSGGSSYRLMPRMEDPQLTSRAANVSTVFPGADAERVETLVTEKIEDELVEIEEIKETRSFSRAGISMLTIELRDDVYESDPIWARIRDKISDASVNLPPEAHEPVFDQLLVKAYATLVALVWDGNGQTDQPVNNAILRRLSEQLEDRLKAIRGTERVDIFGDPVEEVVVHVRPDALIARGLTAQDVSAQLGASDAKISAGQLRSVEGDLLIDVAGELDTCERIGQTPIAFGPDGNFVRLSDIAEIRKGVVEPETSLAIIDGKRGITLGAFVRGSYRIDFWANDLEKVLGEFQSELPRGVSLVRMFDQNEYVESRLSTLLMNLMVGSAMVVIVVLLLMGWRSAVIVGTALPLTALMVLTGMHLLDIPIHQMSVTGLVLALGLLIDNAIVIVDEVAAKIRRGIPRGQAVSRSVSHLAVPLLGSTLTTAFAFGPIALMPGPAGEFVGAIAVSVILAIFSSLLLAMTVIPALTALGLKTFDERTLAEQSITQSIFYEGIHCRPLASLYHRSLRLVLANPWIGIALGMLLPVIGFVQARHLPEQFFPPADRDQIQIEVELPATASLDRTRATCEAIRQQIVERADVEHVHWFIGESAPAFYYNIIPRRQNTPRYAHALVQVSSAQRTGQLIGSLQNELDSSFREARILVRQLEQGPPFDAPIELRVFGPDINRLKQISDTLARILAATPDVIHVRSELAETMHQLSLRIDEPQARLAGLDNKMLAQQMNAVLEGAVAGSVVESTEELAVRVQLDRQGRSKFEQISSIDLLGRDIRSNDSGNDTSNDLSNDAYRGVPLSAIAQIELAAEVTAIPHFDGRRMSEVQAFITAGMLPGKVLRSFEERLDASGYELPRGYNYELGGEAKQRDSAVGSLLTSVGILLVLMIATLVLSFGSFRVMMLVGAVAALSIGLGLGSLWLFGYPFGFMAIIGTMGLIGVAINDSIVVLAAIQENPKSKSCDIATIGDVVMRATRHIVATTLTTIAGFTPLLLGGGGFWPPLAITIAGGVSGATILALYFVPAAYVLLMGQRLSMANDNQPPGHRQVPSTL